jgi:hypothetical protein
VKQHRTGLVLYNAERIVERRAATDADFGTALPARPLELKLDIIILRLDTPRSGFDIETVW